MQSFGGLLLCAQAESPLPLTSLDWVRSQPPETGAKGVPIHVQGIVTYSDPNWGVVFMQDKSGSAFLEYAATKDDPNFPLQRGQLIDVAGITSKGMVHSNVKVQHLSILATNPMPAAMSLRGSEVLSDTNEGRWIRISGWVAAQGVLGDRITLQLEVMPGRTLDIVIPQLTSPMAESFRGCLVEVSGNLALKLAGRKITGDYLLFVSSPDDMRKLKSVPVMPLGELVAPGFQLPTNEPVRVGGNLVENENGKNLILVAGSHRLPLASRQPVSVLPQTWVEVFGYPVYADKKLVLTKAIVHLPVRDRTSLSLLSPTASDTSLRELTQVIQVRNLSPEAAAKGYPLHIVGVITYSAPQNSEQYIQDESAGIFLDMNRCQGDLKIAPGQLVEISGFSGPGEYAPVIHAEQARLLGAGTFPRPHATTVPMMLTGVEDSQWVTLRGVIRSLMLESNQPLLVLATGDAFVKVRLPELVPLPDPTNYVDAAVEVAGVCKTIFNERRRLESVELHVPNWPQIQIKESPPDDPFALPVHPISELSQFRSGNSGLHRTRLQGWVILRSADGSFFLEDAGGGVRVQPKTPLAASLTNQPLEVVGFPSVSGGLPVLQDALFKPLAHSPPVAPIVLVPDSPINEDVHASLVCLEGRVLGSAASQQEERLTVQFGAWVTDAVLEKNVANWDLPSIAVGSVVRLTGVYVARLDDTRKLQSFQVLLRTPADVRVLSRPSWWTSGRIFWVLGGAAAVLLLAVAWIGQLRARVQQRTRQLQSEINQHKRTEIQLQAEIAERKHMQEKVRQTHKELLVVSRQAGMAEVATTVLHNVGNVLNSVNVSADLIVEKIHASKVNRVSRAADLLREHLANLTEFLVRDPKGRQLPDYLTQLSQQMEREQQALLEELKLLRSNISQINEIVTMQQEYANVVAFTEQVSVTDLVEDALRLNAGDWGQHHIELVRQFDPGLPPLTVDKHKVLQILINLTSNARFACEASGRPDKRIIVRISCRLLSPPGPGGVAAAKDGQIYISVTDNGVGIPPENLVRIFNQGFTTRKDGRGFGLHSGALAAKQLGGELQAQSGGVGRGATFTLSLPLAPQRTSDSTPG